MVHEAPTRTSTSKKAWRARKPIVCSETRKLAAKPIACRKPEDLAVRSKAQRQHHKRAALKNTAIASGGALRRWCVGRKPGPSAALFAFKRGGFGRRDVAWRRRSADLRPPAVIKSSMPALRAWCARPCRRRLSAPRWGLRARAMAGADALGGFEPIQARHADIHQDEIKVPAAAATASSPSCTAVTIRRGPAPRQQR